MSVVWTYNCPLDNLDAWQVIADHREFLACADKTKKAGQFEVYQKEVSTMEVYLRYQLTSHQSSI